MILPKHLGMPGKLDVHLWLCFPSVEPVVTGNPVCAGMMLTWGREQSNNVEMRVFLFPYSMYYAGNSGLFSILGSFGIFQQGFLVCVLLLTELSMS